MDRKAKEKAINQINSSIIDRHIRATYDNEKPHNIYLLDDGYWNRARNFFKKYITQRSHYEEKPNYVKRAENYKKQFDSGNTLNILVENNLAKDTTIGYHTTANNILELQKFGMTKSDALTAQVIETVGAYRLDVVKRAIDSGIQTTKTDLKLLIVDQLNDRIKQLQPIERLINLERDKFDSEVIFDYIGNLSSKLYALQDLVLIHNQTPFALPANIKKFLEYDPDYLKGLTKNIEQELRDANKLARQLINLDKTNSQNTQMLKENVSDDKRNFLLANFIRKRLDRYAMDAREQNQQITQGSLDSTFRGRLDQALSNAIILTTNYAFDQHNPITKEHQSDYRQGEGHNKIIYNSREHAGVTKSNLQNVLKVIVTIENGGVTKLLANNQRSEKDQLKTVSSPGWRSLSFKKRNDLFSKTYRELKTKIISSNDLVRSLSTLGKEITGFMVLVLPTIWDNLKTGLLNIRDDYTKHSMWPTVLNKLGIIKKERVLQKIEPPIIDADLAKFIAAGKKEAFEKNPDVAETLNNDALAFATPQSRLHAYKPNDILTDVVSAMSGIIDFVKDDIGDKHPVTFLAIAVAYVSGGAAIIATAQFKAILAKLGLGKQSDQIVRTLDKIATYETSGSKFAEGTTLGFTDAKIVALTANLSTEGFEGWLPKFIESAVHNPVAVIGAVATAYGVGTGIHYAKIPGLTSALRESEGRGAWIEDMVLGGKLTALTSEMLLPSHGHKSKLAEYLGTVLKFALTLVRAVVSIPALSPEPWKELGSMIKTGAASLAYNADALGRKIAQIPKSAIKVLADASVMFISTLAKIQRPFRALFSSSDTSTKSAGLGKLYRGQKSAYNAADEVAREISNKISRAPMAKLGKVMTQKNTGSDAKILEQLNSGSDTHIKKTINTSSQHSQSQKTIEIQKESSTTSITNQNNQTLEAGEQKDTAVKPSVENSEDNTSSFKPH